MSNIKKTSLAIQKKLSLSDYNRIPASQPAGVSAEQLASETVYHGTGIPVEQVTSKPVYQSTNIPASSKIKITFYAGDSEHELLTQMYIDALKSKKKTDKSALICEAIRLLYNHTK